MAGIPILGFAAYSGTGKTTLIERLVKYLNEKEIRVGVVKHDVHGFLIDHEGKDSWRFAKAGAKTVVLSSDEKTALIQQGKKDFWQMIGAIQDVDIILVEGFKQEKISQIGLCRKAALKDFPDKLERYVAIVTDLDIKNNKIPCFGFEEHEELAEYIMKNMDDFTKEGI